MRVVSWNCNGAFRRKYELLDQFDADVLVIQECEDPSQSEPAYRMWADNHLWKGYGKNKGVGVFPRKGQSIQPLDWPDGGQELFVPARIAGRVDLLAVWTQNAKPYRDAYIGQFWRYLNLNKDRIGPDCIVCGDFNSSQIWDNDRLGANHSSCVAGLEDCGLLSLYHLARGEHQGKETEPTFYLYRQTSRPFHIDFAFAHRSRLGTNWSNIHIGSADTWLAHSDHAPLVFEIDFPGVT